MPRPLLHGYSSAILQCAVVLIGELLPITGGQEILVIILSRK